MLVCFPCFDDGTCAIHILTNELYDFDRNSTILYSVNWWNVGMLKIFVHYIYFGRGLNDSVTSIVQYANGTCYHDLALVDFYFIAWNDFARRASLARTFVVTSTTDNKHNAFTNAYTFGRRCRYHLAMVSVHEVIHQHTNMFKHEFQANSKAFWIQQNICGFDFSFRRSSLTFVLCCATLVACFSMVVLLAFISFKWNFSSWKNWLNERINETNVCHRLLLFLIHCLFHFSCSFCFLFFVNHLFLGFVLFSCRAYDMRHREAPSKSIEPCNKNKLKSKCRHLHRCKYQHQIKNTKGTKSDIDIDANNKKELKSNIKKSNPFQSML